MTLTKDVEKSFTIEKTLNLQRHAAYSIGVVLSSSWRAMGIAFISIPSVLENSYIANVRSSVSVENGVLIFNVIGTK